jgi:hypothetical protein
MTLHTFRRADGKQVTVLGRAYQGQLLDRQRPALRIVADGANRKRRPSMAGTVVLLSMAAAAVIYALGWVVR